MEIPHRPLREKVEENIVRSGQRSGGQDRPSGVGRTSGVDPDGIEFSPTLGLRLQSDSVGSGRHGRSHSDSESYKDLR